MQLDQDTTPGSHTIRSYASGQIVVDEEIIQTSVIVTPAQIQENWPPESVNDLTLQHIQMILDLEPEIVLLGTGSRQQFLSQELIIPFMQMNIGLEIMDTQGACRTYNVLMSEGREVAAALFMIQS
jgi:uncharacterized protein